MLRIRFYRGSWSTPNGKTFCIGRLPVKQTLVFAGPVFILIQRGPR